MKTINLILDKFEKWFCSLALIVMTSLVIIQIIFRLTGMPLSWTEELARYSFIWIIYVGISYAARQGKHLKVDVLSIYVKKRGKFVFELITNISSLIFFVVLAYILAGVLHKFTILPQFSPSLKLNMIFAYAAPFVASITAAIRYIIISIQTVQQYSLGRSS